MERVYGCRIRRGPEAGADTLVLLLVGELDTRCVSRVRETLLDAFDECRARLVLDVAALGFCDVAGIRALWWAADEAARRGVWLSVRGAQPWLLRLFTLAGADGLLSCCAAVNPA